MTGKKYRIPRNIKTSLMFIGLDIRGWIIFIPIIIVSYLICFGIFTEIILKIIGMLFSVVLSHLFLQIDEKTGVMNIMLFLERFTWYFNKEKIIYPAWSEDNEKLSTLQIKIKKTRSK